MFVSLFYFVAFGKRFGKKKIRDSELKYYREF